MVGCLRRKRGNVRFEEVVLGEVVVVDVVVVVVVLLQEQNTIVHSLSQC